jgi:N-acetylmuramoyl-L-alanine amidase
MDPVRQLLLRALIDQAARRRRASPGARRGPLAALRHSRGTGLGLRGLAALLSAGALLVLAPPGHGQPANARPGAPLSVLTREGRQALATISAGGHDFVSLDEVARLFGLTVREDVLAGSLSVSRGSRTLVVSTTQGLASASGRLVSLPATPVRQGKSWLVPIELVGRALPLVLDERLEWRPASRLVVLGDLRVPRVVVRHEPIGRSVRVTFEVTPADTRHVVEEGPARLLVRFDADLLDADLAAPPASDVLSTVRVMEPGTTIALELGPAFASYRAADEPAGTGRARLVVDLLAAPAASPAPAAPAEPAGPRPEPPPPLILDTPRTALRTVVIDPGHGGEETGARGPGGTFEKDVTLAVARQLKSLLESRLGVRVLLTRDGDQTVALDDRAALANNNKADLFVSLHANASVRAAVRGAEVFYLSAGEYTDEARRLALAEGAALPVVTGGERRVEMILWEMAQLRHLEDSAALAALVEQELRQRVPMSPRAIQQAPFRVLVGANMPAVLVEMGFMTNPEEERLLASPAHQASLASALYESIVRFRAYLEGGRRPIAPPAAPAAPPGAARSGPGVG